MTGAKSPVAGHAASYTTYSLDEALAGIAGAGFRHVELAAAAGEHVDVHGDPAETCARVAHHGLSVASISAHSDLTTPAGVRHALAALRWAERAGVPIVNTAIGGVDHGPESEEAFLANIGPIADAAEAAGITLALEIHGQLMASGRRSGPLLERVAHPAVKVNYDTANVQCLTGTPAVEDLPLIVHHVAHVHLKDLRSTQGRYEFPAIGDGDVDFAGVLRVLWDAGYAGPLSVEVEFSGELPWPPLQEVDAAMRASHEALADLGAI
jgi:sugar phosphate isomerase/epimerase